jgi:hypothetical protein
MFRTQGDGRFPFIPSFTSFSPQVDIGEFLFSTYLFSSCEQEGSSVIAGWRWFSHGWKGRSERWSQALLNQHLSSQSELWRCPPSPLKVTKPEDGNCKFSDALENTQHFMQPSPKSQNHTLSSSHGNLRTTFYGIKIKVHTSLQVPVIIPQIWMFLIFLVMMPNISRGLRINRQEHPIILSSYSLLFKLNVELLASKISIAFKFSKQLKLHACHIHRTSVHKQYTTYQVRDSMRVCITI